MKSHEQPIVSSVGEYITYRLLSWLLHSHFSVRRYEGIMIQGSTIRTKVVYMRTLAEASASNAMQVLACAVTFLF